MAYSDYGGYAYKNSKRIEVRSDCALMSGSEIISSPGCWPGMHLSGREPIGSYHALMGTGPFYVGLYKQSSIEGVLNGNVIDLSRLILQEYPEARSEYDGTEYVDSDYFKEKEEPWVLKLEGFKLTVYWLIQDNHYQYAQLIEPNGTTWTAFSGYGVGEGLVGAGYGFDTTLCVDTLSDLFPTKRIETDRY